MYHQSFQKKYLNVFHIKSTLMHAAAHVVYVFPLYLSYLYVAAHDQIKLGFEVVKNHCSIQTSGRLGSIIITRSALSSLPSRSRWLRLWWSDRVKSRNWFVYKIKNRKTWQKHHPALGAVHKWRHHFRGVSRPPPSAMSSYYSGPQLFVIKRLLKKKVIFLEKD